MELVRVRPRIALVSYVESVNEIASASRTGIDVRGCYANTRLDRGVAIGHYSEESSESCKRVTAV